MAANNKISKKGTFVTTMGVTSIIAILVILVLIVFSALSITTSKADLTLAQKTAETTSDFYAADAMAEETFAEIQDYFRKSEVDIGTKLKILGDQGFEVDRDGPSPTIAYSVIIDDKKSLFVKLTVDEATENVSRTQWQIRATSEWTPENGQQLIIQ